jgi:hypothetical protein
MTLALQAAGQVVRYINRSYRVLRTHNRPLAKPARKVYIAQINLSHYDHFDDRVWEWAPPDPLFFIAAVLP